MASKRDAFWRWFNPPLPDVMQAEMLSTIESNRPSLSKFVRSCTRVWEKTLFDNVMREHVAYQLLKDRS